MSVAALAAGRIHPSLFAVALGVLAAVRSALRSVAAERERRRRRDDVIVTLREFERGLRAGLSDLEAFRAAVVFPLRAAGIADAVAEWSGALEGEAARAASASLLIGVALGALHPQYVASVSALLAQQRRSEEEAQSQSSQARLSAVVMALAPLLFFVGLVLTDPRASRLMLHTLLGTVILGVGLLFDAAAFMWMRRIVGSAGRGQGR
jgi:Flp pilus assembly protein TadB